jgi:hypothetical protein
MGRQDHDWRLIAELRDDVRQCRPPNRSGVIAQNNAGYVAKSSASAAHLAVYIKLGEAERI